MATGSTIRGVSRISTSQRAYAVAPISGGGVPQITFSTGAAKNLKVFANDMLNLQNDAHDQLDAQAQAEGKFAGAIDGMAGTPALREWGTIRGRAYNEAAVTAFSTTLETNMISKVGELQSKHFGDPEGLKVALGGYSSGVVKEIGKVFPPAVAGLKQRLMIRSQAAVSAAKDDAFKIMKDKSEAVLIMNEAALNTEVDTLSGRLFSDNPEVASTAMMGLGQLRGQMEAIYGQVGPNGQPMFSRKERASAVKKFNARVFEKATVNWFSKQPNKAQAYQDFMQGKFKPKFTTPGYGDVKIINATQGKIRSLPVKGEVKARMAYAVNAIDPGLSIKIVSGGQPGKGSKGRRTGSSRHDHGNSADIVLMRDGKEVLPGEDKELYKQFFENAASAGFTGLGHYPWGVHVGGGKQAAWGPDTGSATLDPEFGEAIERGWKNPANITAEDAQPQSVEVDLRKALPAEILDRVESEMRSQITFNNSLADRNERLEEKEIKAAQDANDFGMVYRYYAKPGDEDPMTGKPVQPLSFEEVHKAVKDASLSPAAGRALLRAMTEEDPATTNSDIYKSAVTRMNDGEDVTSFLLENITDLTKEDYRSLMDANNQRNVVGAGEFTQEQRFHFSRLEDLLTPSDAIMQKFPDAHAQERKFNALSEYRKRVLEGELPESVARDISDRSRTSFQELTRTKLDGLNYPRFSVRVDEGRIDAAASYAALKAAYESKLISSSSFTRQKALLKEWNELQNALKGKVK